jgi:hypothetical protein
MYNAILRIFCETLFPEKKLLNILNVCVALVIQHGKRMHHNKLPYVASLALPHSSTLFHRQHNSRKKTLLNVISEFVFLYNIYLKYFQF